jgi:hypothetical protein
MESLESATNGIRNIQSLATSPGLIPDMCKANKIRRKVMNRKSDDFTLLSFSKDIRLFNNFLQNKMDIGIPTKIKKIIQILDYPL